jgi:uncharacterized protein YfbU (UPF0304 family)
MKLTRTERWMLANQYLILEALYPEDARYYKEVRTVLEEGYELHYDWISQRIYSGESILSEAECKEVIDTLAMFEALQDSYKILADKSGIEEWRVKFRGFDGNHETKQLAYASFFCAHGGGRFQSLEKPKDLNSHSPSLERYRRMLAHWKQSGEEYRLTKEQIMKIISD